MREVFVNVRGPDISSLLHRAGLDGPLAVTKHDSRVCQMSLSPFKTQLRGQINRDEKLFHKLKFVR